MLAEGFIRVGVDRSAGALTAFQETSGSGRPQTLRVSARKTGNGTRVDAVFMIQAGQLADAATFAAISAGSSRRRAAEAFHPERRATVQATSAARLGQPPPRRNSLVAPRRAIGYPPCTDCARSSAG